jgi:hypothetical protein
MGRAYDPFAGALFEIHAVDDEQFLAGVRARGARRSAGWTDAGGEQKVRIGYHQIGPGKLAVPRQPAHAHDGA